MFIQGELSVRFASIDSSFAGDPLAQRLGTYVRFSGDFGDGASGIDDQTGGFVFVPRTEGSQGSVARGSSQLW